MSSKLFASPASPCSFRFRYQPVHCSRGFGSADSNKTNAGKGKKQGASVNKGDAKAVERAVKLVEDRKARPVDNREAVKGAVEFIKVKNWGSGQPKDLGQLEVQASSQVRLASDVPFYEQLAKRLELLEAQGAMPVAQLKGSKPLPPFSRWVFAKAHYLQYLHDLLSVHSALEQALRQCASTAQQQPVLLPAHLQQAVALIAHDSVLYRSQQLMADIQRLAKRSAAESGGGSSEEAAAGLEPSPNAAGLAQFLGSLATRIKAAESAQEASSAVIKVLANAYVLLLVQMTSGGRVGSVAAEKLNLFALGALNTYRTYPPHVKDPIEVLKDVINQWGQLLAEEEREELMEELPSAMQKASLLLMPLAREE